MTPSRIPWEECAVWSIGSPLASENPTACSESIGRLASDSGCWPAVMCNIGQDGHCKIKQNSWAAYL